MVGQTLLLCACLLDETPVVHPDFEEIAANTHFRHEILEQCVQETLLCFAGALRDNKEVEFLFRNIGMLAVRTKVVSMTFFDSCLLELDTTGNMLKALLEVSLSFLWVFLLMVLWQHAVKTSQQPCLGCCHLPQHPA